MGDLQTVALGLFFGLYVNCAVASQSELSYHVARVAADATEDVEGWQRDSIAPPKEKRIELRRTKVAAIKVPLSEVSEVWVVPVTFVEGETSHTTWIASMSMADQYRHQFDKLREDAHEDDLLFLLVDGQKLGTIRLDAVQDRLFGGEFESREDAVNFYHRLGLKIAPQQKPSTTELQQFSRGMNEVISWQLQCDPRYREGLRAEGVNLEQLVKELGTTSEPVDCASEPPTPPTFPGMGNACEESSSKGQTLAGRRVGTWTVSGPRGGTIRLELYDDAGHVSEVVWLRPECEKASGANAAAPMNVR